ncbi:MAG: hypothetical protein H7A25_08560 [Leptospiraceae bacterium]|nr:hypothetical protein [Leptospiraceae bacterium]MCP5499940.1 hypothetical protein [Leptospiraceae bacterium]
MQKKLELYPSFTEHILNEEELLSILGQGENGYLSRSIYYDGRLDFACGWIKKFYDSGEWQTRFTF